jgi:integrase
MMPRKEEMNWEARHSRWHRMHQGVRYRVTCAELGVPPTREGSWKAANDWWRNRMAEVTAARRPHPHQEQLNELAERLAYAKAHGLDEEIPLIEEDTRAAQQLLPQDDNLVVPADVAGFLETLRAIGCIIPEGMEPAVLRELAPSTRLWADRFRRQTEPGEDRTLGHWADRWFAGLVEKIEKGIRATGGLSTCKVMVQEFKDLCGRQTPLEGLDAALWERWSLHCQGQLALRDQDPDKGWSANYARQLFGAAKRMMTWIAEQVPSYNLPRNFSRRVHLARPAKDIRVYTNQELHALVQAAQGQHRLHVLLALNAGMYAVDIAALRRAEIDLQAATITRRRQKTQKLSHTPTVTYPLWPSTRVLLREYLEREGELALRTPNGNPWSTCKLVNGKRTETHAIANYHALLGWRLQIPGSFGGFRKAAATRLRSNPKYRDLREHFLGHSPRSIADRHYAAPDQGLFTEAVLWLGDSFGLNQAQE